MALRDFPSSGSARASARLLRTMALPRQPPLPHYVDGNWVIRDARTPVECRPQADTWGVVRDLKTGFVIILARGESAGIPGRRAGPFQHSRGQESRAWQPTSDDMAQAGMFTNVNGGSTATGSIYGSRANGMGACFCDSSGPNYSSLPAPRTRVIGPVYHSPHAHAWGGSVGSSACGSTAATSGGLTPMSPPIVPVRGTVSGYPSPKQIKPSPPTPFNTFGPNIGQYPAAPAAAPPVYGQWTASPPPKSAPAVFSGAVWAEVPRPSQGPPMKAPPTKAPPLHSIARGSGRTC
jgi:hypothetical protein